MPPPTSLPQPGDTNNYDFIVAEQKPASGSKFRIPFRLTKDPFINKIILIVGGTVLFMTIVGIVISLFFGGKSDVNTFVGLAQREQEILRISALNNSAVEQSVKNAAVNTEISIKSHQNSTLAYLSSQKREVKSKELGLKQDQSADNRLKIAKDTSAFDTTFTSVMRSQLTTYANELKSAYDSNEKSSQRDVLARKYNDVQMLLKMWPAEQNQQ